MSQFNRLCALAGAAIATLLLVAPAQAACFELIGCTDSQRFRLQDLRQLSCENLWYVRNVMYDENGFCFRTDRAREAFSNADCNYTAANQVPLNSTERFNVQQIVKVEKELDCP